MTIETQAQLLAHYWEGYPEKPSEPAAIPVRMVYQKQMNVWAERFAPNAPPDPPPTPAVPQPPSPGAGMPAARMGDLTNHGATIGPATTGVGTNVMIGHKPAACLGDPHLCPMFSGPKAHVGGKILMGSQTVTIGYRPAARVSDATTCTAEPGAIATGEATVLIGDIA